MKAFAYASPDTKEQVVEMLREHGDQASVLAGGTDLLSLMKDRVLTPGIIVSLKQVDSLKSISRARGNNLVIGALVTLDELLSHAEVERDYPSLVQAAQGVTGPQIRSLGTVGGDLCQRPRCWYFRHGFGLLPDHNGKSRVVEGDNRYHAILGASDKAYFVNPSSLAPALTALQARVRIFGPEGQRELPIASFYRVPSSDDVREYDLADDEIVEAVLVPRAGPGFRNATYEIRQREALDWPLAAAAVSMKMRGGRVEKADVVLGHVAPIPWVASAAAASLRGKMLDAGTAEKAGEAAVEGARSLSGNGYKIRLARVAVKRALLRAAGMEG